MKFTLLTRPLGWIYYYVYLLKRIIKKVLFFKTYGPTFVVESLIHWLELMSENISYNIDPSVNLLGETVYVPMGLETLQYAINLKKKWKIKKLIAWPNISRPLSKEDPYLDPLVDIIIVPSEWVKSLLEHLFWEDNRIVVMPAWVKDNGSRKTKDDVIVYYKECPIDLYKGILSELHVRWENVQIFKYGEFKNEDYIKALDTAKYMIYLQMSESQGLAIHEAWMKDVPTFVWNWGYAKYPIADWYDEKISAPYLTEACGEFFSSQEDFCKKLDWFIDKLEDFSPRSYSINNFSYAVSVKRLLAIL